MSSEVKPFSLWKYFFLIKCNNAQDKNNSSLFSKKTKIKSCHFILSLKLNVFFLSFLFDIAKFFWNRLLRCGATGIEDTHHCLCPIFYHSWQCIDSYCQPIYSTDLLPSVCCNGPSISLQRFLFLFFSQQKLCAPLVAKRSSLRASDCLICSSSNFSSMSSYTVPFQGSAGTPVASWHWFGDSGTTDWTSGHWSVNRNGHGKGLF